MASGKLDNAPFYSGQKIVRIGETVSSKSGIAFFVKGEIYTCEHCYKCDCGRWIVFIREFPFNSKTFPNAECPCGCKLCKADYYCGISTKFAPVQINKRSVEIAEGVLTAYPEIKEVSDLPVKEKV